LYARKRGAPVPSKHQTRRDPKDIEPAFYERPAATTASPRSPQLDAAAARRTKNICSLFARETNAIAEQHAQVDVEQLDDLAHAFVFQKRHQLMPLICSLQCPLL
jgi:hypothetical protein